MPLQLRELSEGHHVLVAGLWPSRPGFGSVEQAMVASTVLEGSMGEGGVTRLHNLSCLQAALRSPHLRFTRPLSDAACSRCDALRCHAAAVAWHIPAGEEPS
jgi:hypothetical protein